MIVVSDEEYQQRMKDGTHIYWEKESCTYKKGYIDGKYISTKAIKQIAEHGGEPSKFAFRDNIIAFSRIEGLEALIKKAAEYPTPYKAARMKRFYALLQEWQWYYHQGVESENTYLINMAVSNIVLYGGRALLA